MIYKCPDINSQQIPRLIWLNAENQRKDLMHHKNVMAEMKKRSTLSGSQIKQLQVIVGQAT